MSLPAGWRYLTPEDLVLGDKSALVIGPFGSDLRTSDYTSSGVPLVFVRDIRHKDFASPRAYISESKASALRSHTVLPGDVLVTKMGDPPGDACVYTGKNPAVITADCIRLRAAPGFDPSYISYALESPDARRQIATITSGVAQLKVSLARFRSGVRLPVPPLEEQRRIVEILEDHLSRLDAADGLLKRVLARIERMATAALWRATHDHADAAGVRLADVADVRLGRQRSPANHTGNRMRPYLRAANVDWNRLRLDDVKEMNFTASEEATYRLEPNDILLTEASGSAAEVGKSVLYLGEPNEVCFQNTLLRVRCHGAEPAFVQKYLLAEARAGRFMPESRGVGINHLGRARLAALEIRLPTRAAQLAGARECERELERSERLVNTVTAQLRRSASLRRALLTAAFEGRLTGRPSDLEPAEQAGAATR